MPLVVKVAVDNFSRRPVTCVLIALVACYTAWTGFTLLLVDIPPERLISYKGVLNFGSLHGWGFAYLFASVVELTRLVVLKFKELEVALHMVTTAVLFLWAFGFFLGPTSVGQPGFFFVFAICAFTPFVNRIVLSWKERQD